MIATFTINQLQFQLEAETAIDLFSQVAKIQEIFEAETHCGACDSEEIKYAFRVTAEGHKYYELQCRKCGAQFKFGQKKHTNELFPKRKDEQGNPLPNGGWSKWVPRDNEDSRPTGRPASSGGAPPARPDAAIPDFKDWDVAEKSDQFQRGRPIRVNGVLWHIPAGARERSYVEAPQHAQAR